jgi:predicted CxxxxCH...CXXCH cytochrome family protein
VVHNFILKCLLFLFIGLLLTACSSGDESTIDFSTTDGTITQGVAVDPYIEGAVFQEIAADTGSVLQRQSSPSDEFGVFTFPQPLTPGSIIEMKVSNKGLHGGAPFQGLLRRAIKADDDSPVVVSPLTTLLANGAGPEELITLFHNAGLSDLTTSDLYADPMQGLADMTTGITDQDLKLLQASMAANAYMEVTENFLADANQLNDFSQFEIFSSMIDAVGTLLNAGEFENIAAALANDPDMTSPLILDDFILAVLAQQQTIVALAKEDIMNNGVFSPVLVDQAVQEARGNAVTKVKMYYSQRVPPAASYDGATLYHDTCSTCHDTLDSTSKPGRSAADIQAAIDGNLGGMGFLSTLTADEVQAIADVLPAAPVVDPGLPPDGIALYSSECEGCHGTLDSTSKPGRSAADIQAAIDGNLGGMGFLSTLTADEVQAIADALPAAPVVDPGPDYSDCTVCHGQPPSGNNYPNTAGAHTVHTALASVGGNCSICHLEAAHNSQVDLGFPAGFNAKSGPATDNLDGTCSNIKCHGGKITPDWWSGNIAVDTQCTSCHASGTSQYNSYSSGQHSRHIRQGYSCTVCHNTTKLRNGHFSNLESSGFELSPASTIGGGSTRVGSYSNGTCSSVSCHGSHRW